jgi:PKD repeat protein
MGVHPGRYDVDVMTYGELGWFYKADAFTVSELPTLTGISPSSGARGTTIRATVTGTNFIDGAQVALKTIPGIIYASDEVTVSPTEIRCTLSILETTPGGLCDLQLMFMDTMVLYNKQYGFTVLDPLTVTGITPPAGNPGSTITADVHGLGFVNGARFSLWNDGTWVNATEVARLSATHLRGTLALPPALPVGTYRVYVINPGMTEWTHYYDGFAVTPPPPAVTGIAPPSAARGSTFTALVSGTTFVEGTEIAIDNDAGTWIDATGEETLGPTQVRCTLAIPPGAPTGPYDVNVWNPGMTEWMEKADAFTVTAPSAPTVTGVLPASGIQGTAVPVTVSGTGFQAGATVKLARAGQADIVATNVVVVTSAQITCRFAVPSTAPVGAWQVVVTNPGGEYGVLAGGFTVTDAGVTMVPGAIGIPTDPNGDGLYEDVNGNGRADFADVVLYFNQMSWIAAHEPLSAFDYNGNGRIDFADVVWLFNHL